MNLKRFFIRDINTVGRRERIAAGIVSTIVGSALIVAEETSEGASPEGSVTRVIVATVMGIVACIVYSKYQKRKAEETRESRKGNSFSDTIADTVED